MSFFEVDLIHSLIEFLTCQIGEKDGVFRLEEGKKGEARSAVDSA